MKAWESFYPEILMFVPGCPDMLVDQELRRATREFFKKTGAWVEWLGAITTVADVRSYDIDIPTGSVIRRLEKATINGQQLDVQSFRSLTKDIEFDTLEKPGLSSPDRQTISLSGAYPDGQVIRLQATLIPSMTAGGVEDYLFEYYSEDLINGAKARLMMIPGPFYKPDLAAVALQSFNAGIATKTVDAWKSDTASIPRAKLKLC
jgi:hypothetical protein